MTVRPQRLGDGRYRIRVYAGTNPATGKPKQLSKVYRADNDRHAARLAAAIEAELRAAAEQRRERTGTIDELADEWLALKRSQGRSVITIEGYEHHLVAIRERFGRTPVHELTGRDIDRWNADRITAGDGVPTIKARHAVLRGMLRQARKWGMTERVATEEASPPEYTSPERDPRTPAAIAAALAATPPSQWRRMIEFTAITGLRRGEVCGLRWSDIRAGMMTVERAVAETIDHELVVKGTKTNRTRKIPLGPTAQSILVEQLAHLRETARQLGQEYEPGDLWVFPDLNVDVRGRRPRAPKRVTESFRRWRDQHGLDGFTFHDLRHLNATVMLAGGADLHAVQRLEGHANAATTLNTYGHATDAGVGRAVELAEENIGRVLRSGS